MESSKRIQEPGVSDIVQELSAQSEQGNIQFLEPEVISENVPKAETVIEETKYDNSPTAGIFPNC